MLEDAIAVQWTFNRLIQGFMGLGLIVGVAALGVISARAVVERRQQIGVLRAIGFRRRMIQVSFLHRVVVHRADGDRRRHAARPLIVAVNVIDDVGSQPSWDDLDARRALGEPRDHLRASSTWSLSRRRWHRRLRASRIRPAEALRYE